MFLELGLFDFLFNIWENMSQDRVVFGIVTTSQWFKSNQGLFLLYLFIFFLQAPLFIYFLVLFYF